MSKVLWYHRFTNDPSLKNNSREKIQINTNIYTMVMSEVYDLICGAIAGCVSRTSTAPLELKKLQLQNPFIPNTTIRSVIQKEGFLYLWKGNLTNCIRIAPQTAINFTVYNQTKKLNLVDSPNLNNSFAGTVAGFVSTIATYPLDNARARLALQTNNGYYSSLADVFRKVPMKDLFKGLNMTLMGFIPYNALSFTIYSNLRDNNYFDELPFKHLLYGGFAGVGAVSITYPSDLVRRRLQLQGFDKTVPKYNGIVDCFKTIVKTEGITGLYRGLLACYIKLFPTMAIQFATLEYLKQLRKQHF